ncbi:MAG: DUF4153 domain-containing protein [Candidatus Krumholzibacteria bacterium]|nr:DUF4153 domain-containing protein [Candidatus Krumholzibacteria bacterium]
MRFPSLRLFLTEATSTLFRFPAVLLSAVLAAVTGIAAIGQDQEPDVLLKVMVSAQLGIPLFFAIAVLSEKDRWAKPPRFVFALMGAAALIAYYFLLPEWISPLAMTRLVQLHLGLHLLVAFVPFIRPHHSNAFWQYNKSLFLRFLLAALYSTVFFVGLAIALAALDKLFGLEIDGDTYLKLWVGVVMIFNTWFFLGGVPRDLSALEGENEYPTGLKVFTQFVLIPLVVLYLLILTTYLGKIVITQVWPSGWIGYLVSSVACAGILSHLLVYPIREQLGNKWIKTFSRWFYILLVPSIVMLMMAIYKRITQYGVTEPRYFLVVLAIWLAAVSVYYAFGRARGIKVIPLTLCLLAFVTSFGPWGAYRVSEKSQVNRLQSILVTNSLLVDGTLQPSNKQVSFEDRKEISGILRYLVNTHGVGAIQDWFPDSAAPLDSLGEVTVALRPRQSIGRVRVIMGLMNLEYAKQGATFETDHFSYASDPLGHVFRIQDYDFLVRLTQKSKDDTLTVGDEYAVVYDANDQTVRLKRKDDLVLEIKIVEVVDRLRRLEPGSFDPSAVPVEQMTIQADNNMAAARLHVVHISGDTIKDEIAIDYFTGDCFIRLKK